jgi:hypothetical protein
MVPFYITIRMVLSLNRLKTSNMYNDRSARALFSAPNHILHLLLDVPILRKKNKKIKGCLHTHSIYNLSITT